MIAETNQIAPGARLAAGTRLRIPEIPGVPFVLPEARPPQDAARPPVAPPPDASRPGAPPAAAVPETPEVNPLLAEARESFDKGDLVAALGDVDRFLASDPGAATGSISRRRCSTGRARPVRERASTATPTAPSPSSPSSSPSTRTARTSLRQARVRLVDQHYSDGIRLYREEKLKEAIAEWRAVLVLDPEHAGAKRNIEQAERLLRGLEERRKK